jgi:hypothetical protein
LKLFKFSCFDLNEDLCDLEPGDNWLTLSFFWLYWSRLFRLFRLFELFALFLSYSLLLLTLSSFPLLIRELLIDLFLWIG